jgi:hypothetical protein
MCIVNEDCSWPIHTYTPWLKLRVNADCATLKQEQCLAGKVGQSTGQLKRGLVPNLNCCGLPVWVTRGVGLPDEGFSHFSHM